MLSAARITFRIHRFEFVVAALAAAAAGLALAYLALQIREIGIPDGCWPRDVNGDYGLPECNRLLRRFWNLSGASDWITAFLPFVALVVGILSGVTLVAREVELRTAELAWSLTRHRSRWLVQRLLPALAFALVLLVVLGALGQWYFDALAGARRWPELTELASFGIGLVARGVLAMGVALLFGAVAGRTMPALILAAIVLLAWSLVGVPAIQRQVAQERAVWRQEGDWRTGEGQLLFLRSRRFDVTQPGLPGRPGKRISQKEAQALRAETCGERSEADADAAIAFDECQDTFWESIQWAYVVPQSEFDFIQRADAAVSLALGGAAFLLTFPIVARRRPS